MLATGSCPHQTGRLALTTTNTRVFVNMTQAVLTLPDLPKVAGCLFQIPFGVGTKPQPCVIARLVPSTRVFVNMSQPVVINAVTGAMCQSAEGIPQGPPLLVTQTRVIAT
jgi:hypothetical protein